MTETVLYGIPALIGFFVTLIVFFRYRRDQQRVGEEELGKRILVTRNVRIVGQLSFICFLNVALSILVLTTHPPRPEWFSPVLVATLILVSWLIASICVGLYISDVRLERAADLFYRQQHRDSSN